MRKKLILFFLYIVLCGYSLKAQTLDEAILGAAVKISNDLPTGAVAAIINFRSASGNLNDYVINELYGAILRNRKITPVKPDQNQQRNLQNRLNPSRIGMVDKELAQDIGQMLETQYLITGTMENTGILNILRFYVIDTENAEPVSQYSNSVNLQIDTQLALLLGNITAGSAPTQTRQEKALTPTGDTKPVSLKFSFGVLMSISCWNGKEYYDDNSNDESYGETNISLAFSSSLRLLLSLENQLRFGLGGDFAIGTVEKIASRNGGITDPAIIGTLAPNAIIGYNNVYLHIGYDFALGALYLAPCFIIKEHLLLGLPMSLFGSNQRVSIASRLDPSNKYNEYKNLHYKFESEIFQIGLSIQYVF